MPIPTAIVRQLSDQSWVASAGDMLMQFWGSRTEAAMAQKVHHFASQFFERRIAPRVGVVYIEADSDPPDSAARTELKKLGKLFEENLIALAYVYGGTGFKAVAIRSVMSAILFVNSLPTKVAVKTFSAPGEACDWLATKVVGNEITAEERKSALLETIKRFRTRVIVGEVRPPM